MNNEAYVKCPEIWAGIIMLMGTVYGVFVEKKVDVQIFS